MADDTRLPLHTESPADERLRELRRLLPEAFTEGKLDVEKLQAAIGGNVATGRERYGLNWAGKSEAVRTLLAPGTGTLRPCPDESVNFDTTENLVIEGDNLEVLKLLQKSYHGKVKLIYIDPPYNTGNDFIYADDFRSPLDAYRRYTGEIDDAGNATTSNRDTSGRFHSNWLNMMYPRLHLARSLLREDGVIFVSIDDNEVHNLRMVMNEVFGEENFIACMIWEKGRKNDAKLISVGHEYILVFAKSSSRLKELKTIWREEKPGAREIWEKYLELRRTDGSNDKAIENHLQTWFSSLPKTHPSKKWSRYKRVDKNGPWRDRDISWPGGGGPRYDVIHPVTGIACAVPERGWIYADPEVMQRQIALGLVEFRGDHTEPPFRKAHIRPIPEEVIDSPDDETEYESAEDEEFATQVRGSYFYKQSQVSVKLLRTLLGAKVFNHPKDHMELSRLIAYATSSDKEAIILDFFAGSGSTGQAVMDLNKLDGGNRRFILVQLPEQIDPSNKEQKAAAAYCVRHGRPLLISELTKERIRRAGEAIRTESPLLPIDHGFRALRLDTSNFKRWDDATAPAGEQALGTQLSLHADHLVAGRSDLDLLFELALRTGLPLSAQAEELKVGKQVAWRIVHDEQTVLFCLANPIEQATLDALRALKPDTLVCLDAAFAGNDALKTNTVLQMKDAGIRFHTA